MLEKYVLIRKVAFIVVIVLIGILLGLMVL